VGLLFGEDQGRYIIVTNAAETVESRAGAAHVPVRRIGVTGGDALEISGQGAIAVAELKTAHEGWLPNYMAGMN
jgi:phosphoribosylformylglycinamidine synthase